MLVLTIAVPEAILPLPSLVVVPLAFRLTIGLRKIDGQWSVVHEHHSIPAT
ncbi:nuclear transport factor 2 family protein [Methylobacter sp.]|uniref:nuclear transport factor 2 family protein n=1 Tax=Methylobacter sp. TaxID=2051955 RepID=UPI00121101BF|nr:MAG: hypothetical protein EPO18_13505 [Methylobacter sp.]